MNLSIADAMNEFISSNTDMCVFVTAFLREDYEIISSGILSKIIENDKEPLHQLCGNERIHPADSIVVTAMCGDLLDKKSARLPDERFSVDFRADVSENAGEPDYRWFKLTILAPRNENGGIKHLIGHILMMNNSEILTRTILDNFTNDKHPMVFTNRAKQILDTCGDRQVVFLQFDIEKFKLINTTYGEDKGTEILNFINNGLSTVCTDDQVYIRLSADVFMICTAFDDISEIERLISIIEERFGSYQGISYKLVFGVNIITDKTIPIRKMGDRAAIARQGIKGNAIKNVAYYTDNQENTLVSRKYIEDRMDAALANNEFVMFLQPKYSISGGKVVGAEALVRWISPERGIISPAEFIPIFEKNHFIVKLDRCIWKQVCKTIRDWIDMGVEPIPVSVNISRVHLENDNFIKVLSELVEKYRVPKELLEIEITESADSSGTDAMIIKLHDEGYVLLMDDFGSGYSSLNMLKNTPFDVIKIDRDFFSEFMLSDRGKKIIAHTISMSKDIGMGLVAEGIETEEQAKFISECGCDVAQGFYYSKPVCRADFEKLAFNR